MNPVLLKDLLALLRLKRVAAVQITFVAVLALLVIASWPRGGVVGGTAQLTGSATGGDDVAAAATTDAGPSLIRTDDRLLVGLIVGQLVMMILFVPGVAATALTGEKEANTLEMLYASRLRPGQIISGKIGLAVAYPLVLLASGLPFLALLNWRGDVRTSDLLWGVGLLATTSVFLSVLSLTVSALCRTSAVALVVSYLIVLAVCGATLVPAAIMLAHTGGTTAEVLHYVRSVSPVAAALSRLRPGLIEVGAARDMLPISYVFVPAAWAVTALCAGVIVLKLRRPPVDPEAFGAGGAAGEDRSLGRRMVFLIDPKKRRRPIGPAANPVASKERRTAALSSGRWMIRIFYGALFLSLALSVMAMAGQAYYADLLQHLAAILVAFQVGLIALVTPSLTSPAVSSEVENGTFEMLRLTRLRAGQIFWGKFLPGFLPAVLPVAALVPSYFALAWVNPGYAAHFQKLMPVIAMAVLFCCTLGLACSCFVPRTAQATVAAYLVTAALFVLPLLAWWASGDLISTAAGTRIAFVSPLVMALNVLPGAGQEVASWYGRHLWVMGGLCVLLAVAARARLAVLLRQG
jgi:ABC-type transport system involved in multi-copper enzyme maturation permease subunit